LRGQVDEPVVGVMGDVVQGNVNGHTNLRGQATASAKGKGSGY